MLSAKQGRDMACSLFVVGVHPQDGSPFKAFETRQGAQAFAADQVKRGAGEARIYESPSLDHVPLSKRVPAAIAAIQMGEGTYLESRCARATNEAAQREWKRVQKIGPTAVLKFLGLR
jgi:hypothetical protein